MGFSKLILSVFFAAGFLFAAQQSVCAQTTVDGIAIVINDSVVTLSEYRKKEKEIRERAPDASKEDIVNSLVVETIIELTAEEKKISVSKQELSDAVENFKTSLNLDDAGFVKMLGEKKTTLNEFFDEIKLQILTRKLVQSEVSRGNLYINDKKIEEFYLKKNPRANRSAEVRIAHILMSKEPADSLEKAKNVADSAGSGQEDFAVLARRHSIDVRTAEKGGDLGYFKYDELIKPLLKAVEGAKTGDINGPVESKAGFHIVKVLAIKEEGTLVPPEIRASLIDEIASVENERIISSLIDRGFENFHIDIRI